MKPIGVAFVLFCLLLLPRAALAACSSPTGSAGDIQFSSIQNIMVYCNDTNWVAMGEGTGVSFGTLTNGDFCLATGSSSIACTTATVNLTTQASGTLQAAQFPALTGNVTSVAGSLATTIAPGVVTNAMLAGSIAASKFVGTDIATVGTIAAGTWNGTKIGVAYGGTNADLSATGGTSQVLKQTSSGAAVTVARLACADLSNAAASCSTDATSASNITSGILGVAYGGTGAGAFTLGSVVFAGASGTYTLDNSNFFWDATNHRLGIGTTVPATSLTVNGDVAYQLAADWTTTGAQNNVAVGTTSALRYNGAGTATFTGIASAQAGKLLYLHNASSSALTLSNQSVSSTAANRIVTGTGTDLIVAAGTSIQMQYDGSASRWRVVGGSGTPAGSDMQVQFNSSNAFAADSNLSWDYTNHRLGVGTAVPLYTQHVNGTAAAPTVNVIPRVGTYTTGSVSGGVTINTGATGQMAYYSGANAISGTSNLYVSSTNIGIGTSTPTNLLSLSGAAAQTIWMERSSGTGNNLTLQAGGGQSAGTNKNGGTLILASGVSTGTGASGMSFNVYGAGSTGSADNAATTAMTISSAGNVGIGTATPDRLLTLYAATDPEISLTDTLGTRRMRFGVSTAGSSIIVNALAHAVVLGNDNGALQFGTAASAPATARMIIDTSGNVGIGTTSPGYKLDVVGGYARIANSVGSGDVQMIITDSSGTANSVYIGAKWPGTGWPGLGTNNATNLSLVTNSAVRMTIESSGLVGIGTTTPLRALEVNNGLRLTNSSSDANDGVIGSGTFTAGLNIVGINTNGTFRQINVWGQFYQQQNDGTNRFQGVSSFYAQTSQWPVYGHLEQ